MKEVQDEGTTLCDAETDSVSGETETLVTELPSSTSTMSTCDAERDSHAEQNSNAGGGIANFTSTTDTSSPEGTR